MKIICSCGKEMTLNLYEPDQDEAMVGYDCECGSSLYGTEKQGENTENEYSELYIENINKAEKDKLDKLIEASKALINILSNDENDYPDSSTYRMIMDKCSAVQEVLNEIK